MHQTSSRSPSSPSLFSPSSPSARSLLFCSLLWLATFGAALGAAACAVGEPVGAGWLRDDEPATLGSVAHVLRPPPRRELAAELPDLRLWISPIVRREQRAWHVEGRASVELRSVASWIPDDACGEARLTGSHSFTITLHQREEQSTLASGMPLFVTLSPLGGRRAEAAIWLGPRLVDGVGSTRLRWRPEVAPVWVAGDVEYRGQLVAAPGWSLVPAPPLVARSRGRGDELRPVWTFAELADALSSEASQLSARARRGDEEVSRSAGVELRVLRLGITRDDPREVWPRVCELPVLACLEELADRAAAGESVDVEECGSYRQVQACGGLGGGPGQPMQGRAL